MATRQIRLKFHRLHELAAVVASLTDERVDFTVEEQGNEWLIEVIGINRDVKFSTKLADTKLADTKLADTKLAEIIRDVKL